MPVVRWHFSQRLFFLVSIFISVHVPRSDAATSKSVSPKPVEILLYDGGPRHPHQRQVHRILETETKRHCRQKIMIREHSLFNPAGEFDIALVQNSLKRAINRDREQILHLSWNHKATPKYQVFLEEIRKALSQGLWIVAAAGENTENPEDILRLSETVMGSALGQHERGFVIGELTEAGHLAPRSHYGSELLTALRPPSPELQGSSFSAPLFTARLACALTVPGKNNPPRPRKRKDSSHKTYPPLEDLF